MADIAKLKAVIDADAYGLAWAGKDDATVANEINTQTTTQVQVVPNTQVLLWAASNGRMESIFQAQTTAGTDTLKGLCRAALKLIDIGVDYNRTDHLGFLNTLVAAAIITQADADALDNQADVTVTIAQKESLGKVREGVVTAARSLV